MAKISTLPVADNLVGTEYLPIVQGDATKRVTMSAFRALITPFLQNWYKGDRGETGAAANTRPTLAKLKSAPITDLTSLYDGSVWYWSPGDFSATPAAQINRSIVQADGVDLSAGAWVRQRGAGTMHRGSAAGSIERTVSDAIDEGKLSVFQFMSANEAAVVRLRSATFDCTAAINLAFAVAQATSRTAWLPDGVYLVGNLIFGSQNQQGQSSAPCGLVGESKAGAVLKAKPGLTGTLLKSQSVAGVTFRNFGIDTTGSRAVAWDCRWVPFVGPSTQCVIEHVMITVHDEFKDGTTAHVNWNDLNDTYPRGVTVRPGVDPSYTNCYISMVQSGGLSSLSGCIWTGGYMLFGCQNGEILHCWGHGILFANGCLNHVKVSAGYMYANPVWKTIFRSQNMGQNSGLKSLIIDATELNSAAASGILSYFDINLFGSLLINGCEFIGTAPALFHPTARGDGESPAFCKITGGTHIGIEDFGDCANGARIEVECEGLRDSVTGLMVTKNRGGDFLPVIRGSTSIGTCKLAPKTRGSLIRHGNIVEFCIRIEWSEHTAIGDGVYAIITVFPYNRGDADFQGASLGFADPSFARSRASFDGNQIVFYREDNSLVPLSASGSVTVTGFYTVKA